MKRLALLCALLCLPFSFCLAGSANLPSVKFLYVTGAAPSNGTNEVQTITFGSGQSSGTFYLRFNNRTTPAITWSATNATLVANIDTALESLGNIGTGGVTTAVGTMTAGIGTITVTFTGNNAKLDVPQMTVPSKTTSGTIAVSTTTPGVTADGRTSGHSTLCLRADTGGVWWNAGTSPTPNWTPLVAAP